MAKFGKEDDSSTIKALSCELFLYCRRGQSVWQIPQSESCICVIKIRIIAKLFEIFTFLLASRVVLLTCVGHFATTPCNYSLSTKLSLAIARTLSPVLLIVVQLK